MRYITLLLFSAINIFAQISTEWVARYNAASNYHDYGTDFVLDADNNLYAIGRTKYNDDEKWAILKYNQAGIMQWDIQHNGPFSMGDDEAISIAVSNYHGAIYVTGYERAVNSGPRNIVTKKITFAGNEVWSKTYKQNNDKPYKIAVSKFGNVFVAGQSGNSALLIKYNQNGDSLWVKRFNHYNLFNTEFVDIETDSTENIYCVSQSGNDIISTKFSSGGNLLWERSYNGTGNGLDEAYATCLDIYGNFYAAGQSKGADSDYDFIVISYDNSGALRWESRITSPQSDDDAALDIQADNAGNIYATGYIDAAMSGSNYLTVKYNSNGLILWQKEFNSPSNKWDISESIAIGPDYSVYITGRSGVPPSPFNPDYYTVKYTPNGTQVWAESYNGQPNENGEDIPQGVLVDNNSNVYVSGWSIGSENYDICTIKYSQNMTGINPVSPEIPSEFSLSQNYPNPFNPATKIKFDIPNSSFTSIKVYDMLGNNVAVLINEDLKPGVYEVSWDAASYTSGVYFYKLITGNFTETRKMILIK